jgi:phage repressor protein C with HTH and peptisase S24 domain
LALLIGKEFDVRTEWLVDGAGEMRGEEPMRPESRAIERVPDVLPAAIPPSAAACLASGDYAFVPLFDVNAAAGDGAIVGREEISDLIVLNRTWIRREINARPEDLAFLYVEGDSMKPWLEDGDIILLDRGRTNVARDGVFVIRIDGELKVKRLQKLPGNILKVRSDNTLYETVTLDLNGDVGDFAVIGKVLRRLTRT